MPQYRVKLRVTSTTLVDMIADDIEQAMLNACAAFGGTDGVEITPLTAHLIAGQEPEPEIAEPVSRYAGVLEGDEG